MRPTKGNNNLSSNQKRESKKNSNKNTFLKSLKQRQFGDFCFDYLSKCKHNVENLSIEACPLCKLANYSIRTVFKQEEDQKMKAREESIQKRSLLRTKLLYQWSLCHSINYQEYSIDSCYDLIWSKSLVDSLVEYETISSDEVNFDHLALIIKRRNRMLLLGNFAAIFIQKHIRRYIANRRVRKIMLSRIEFVPATKTKPEYYYDTKKLRRWNNKPKILGDEGMSTPRTIQRRMNFEFQQRENQLSKYLTWLEDQFASQNNPLVDTTTTLINHQEVSLDDKIRNILKYQDFMSKEETLINYLKRLVLVRDLIAIQMFRIAIIPNKMNTKPIEILPSGLSSIWISLSAPAMPCRSLGLSRAIEMTSSPAQFISTPSAKLGLLTSNPQSFKGKSDQPTSTSPTNKQNPMNTNRALQILEKNIWECLKCSDPEEAIQVILSGDLFPVYASVSNISQDEFGIWDGKYSKIDSQVTNPQTPNVENEDNNILPFGLQIRPFYMDHNPSGLFRLFFYEDEFIGGTSLSPWVFYPEVMKNRDVIYQSIRKFISQPKFRTFLRESMIKLNSMPKATNTGNPTTASTSVRKASVTPSTNINSRKMSNLPGAQSIPRYDPTIETSLFVPSIDSIFQYPSNNQSSSNSKTINFHDESSLSDEQILYLSSNYSFVNKIKPFQYRLSRVQNNIKRRDQQAKNNKSKGIEDKTSVFKSEESKESNSQLPSLSMISSLLPLDSAPKTPSQARKTLLTKNKNPSNQDKLDEMKNFFLASNNNLKGPEIYRLLEEYQAISTLKSVPLPPPTPDEANIYLDLLYQYSVGVDYQLNNRIHPKDEVNLEDGSFAKPKGQLLVVDVLVDLPKPAIKGNKANAPSSHSNSIGSYGDMSISSRSRGSSIDSDDHSEGSMGSQSSLSTVGTESSRKPPKSEDTAPPPNRSSIYSNSNSANFDVNIFEVVGLFPCDQDKCPPNLDCGLFSFHYFYQLHKDMTAINSGITASGTSSKSSYGGSMGVVMVVSNAVMFHAPQPSIRERGWTPTDNSTGITAAKAISISGKESQFLILGSPPSKAHLEKILPKSVKNWLGFV